MPAYMTREPCIYRRKSRVCGQYTRQDHPMENSEKKIAVLQCIG